MLMQEEISTKADEKKESNYHRNEVSKWMGDIYESLFVPGYLNIEQRFLQRTEKCSLVMNFSRNKEEEKDTKTHRSL